MHIVAAMILGCIMKEVHYIKKTNVLKEMKLALVADIHNKPAKDIIRSLKDNKPDYITICGDLLSARTNKGIYYEVAGSSQHFRGAPNASRFLYDAVKISKVILSTGNHELYLDEEDKAWLKKIGVIYLNNEYISIQGLVFGGLSSPYNVLAGTGNAKGLEEHKKRWNLIFDSFDYSWLPAFCSQKGCKILLSHHPEIYEQHLKKLNGIDLILSGHAHGGQIRLFGHGLYAYGQGWFPKYTGGMYDGKLIVSRGLSNTSRIPRIGNPTELVYIDLIPIK